MTWPLYSSEDSAPAPELSLPDAIERAKSYKDEGNSAFSSGNNEEAKRVYNEGIKVLEKHKDATDVPGAEF